MLPFVGVVDVNHSPWMASGADILKQRPLLTLFFLFYCGLHFLVCFSSFSYLPFTVGFVFTIKAIWKCVLTLFYSQTGNQLNVPTLVHFYYVCCILLYACNIINNYKCTRFLQHKLLDLLYKWHQHLHKKICMEFFFDQEKDADSMTSKSSCYGRPITFLPYLMAYSYFKKKT